MQTFLPIASFEGSALILDYRRLGKQRVEAYQLVQAIITKTAWSNHPAAKMWSNYIDALKIYQDFMIEEWVYRGYNNTMLYWFNGSHKDLYRSVKMPSWFGNEEFHASHRSNLLRKDEKFYKKFNWNEPRTKPYVWPIST